MFFLPDWYSANANEANIIPKNAMIGRVADFGRFNKVVPHAYRKIDITSKTTNIKTYA
jgi:hypothetical protein